MNRMIMICIVLIYLLSSFSLAEIIGVPGDYTTIQEAIDAASDGDTVLVEPGTYVENIDFHGTEVVLASQFLMTGDRSFVESTVIDGNADSSAISIENFEAGNTAVIGFSITNGLGTGDWPNVRGGGIHISGGAQPMIRYCEIYDNESVGSSNRGAGVYANTSFAYISNCRIWGNTSGSGAGISIGNGANGTVVDSCEVFENIGAGIQIGYSTNVTINRTISHNNAGWGIRNFDSDNTVISHSTITENEDAGLHVGAAYGSEDVMYLVNSIIWNNTVNWEVNEDSGLVCTYSIVQGGTDSTWFGEGCLDSDPMFTDESYALDKLSPAIDAGDPNSEYDPDFTIADMGAHFYEQPVGIFGEDSKTPTAFTLHKNYPNPFNPGTVINVDLEKTGNIQLSVFNALGQHVIDLSTGITAAGSHQFSWDGTTSAGTPAVTGVYFYQLSVDGVASQTRKMMLVR